MQLGNILFFNFVVLNLLNFNYEKNYKESNQFLTKKSSAIYIWIKYITGRKYYVYVYLSKIFKIVLYKCFYINIKKDKE